MPRGEQEGNGTDKSGKLRKAEPAEDEKERYRKHSEGEGDDPRGKFRFFKEKRGSCGEVLKSNATGVIAPAGELGDAFLENERDGAGKIVFIGCKTPLPKSGSSYQECKGNQRDTDDEVGCLVFRIGRFHGPGGDLSAVHGELLRYFKGIRLDPARRFLLSLHTFSTSTGIMKPSVT